jgi:hypothetical protein
MLRFTGKEYLYIDIANQYGNGLDHTSFTDRIGWAVAHQPQLRSQKFLSQAEDPYRYAAAVIALEDAENNIPTGHMVGMDACASGLQMLAAVTGCRTSAYNTGLIGNKRKDVYGHITQEINTILGSTQQWPPKLVKKAAMTYAYGSQKKPKEAFGEGEELEAFYESMEIVVPGPTQMIPVLIHTWNPEATHHAWPMPDGFQIVKPVLAMKDTRVEIDELDHAKFTYRHQIVSPLEGEVKNAADITHSIDGLVMRELHRRCHYNTTVLIEMLTMLDIHLDMRTDAWQPPAVLSPLDAEFMWQQTGFLSLYWAEQLYKSCRKQDLRPLNRCSKEFLIALADLIAATREKTSFPVVSIHDEFKAHANNMNWVRQTYIEILAELAEAHILEYIIEHLTGEPFVIEGKDPNLGNLIRTTGEYALS